MTLTKEDRALLIVFLHFFRDNIALFDEEIEVELENEIDRLIELLGNDEDQT